MSGVGTNLFSEDLVFAMDTGWPLYSNDKRNTHTFKGRPTSNEIGTSMSVYNNVGSHVSITLNATSETYMGAPVYEEIMTPITESGVSYLTAGNNPGIGVVHGGGGGNANQYSGHSIYFKPLFDTHTCPIFTHYSNIGGWQSSCNYTEMGDGWYRATNTWYNTATQGDGKYWAINPKIAYLNQPLTVLWAAPFRESINSPTVSPYTIGSRETTESLIDATRNSVIDVSTISFDSDNLMFFDGSNDVLNTTFPAQTIATPTIEAVVYRTSATGRYESIIQINTASDDALYVYPNGNLGFWPHGSSSLSVPVGQFVYVAASYNGAGITYCVNGSFSTNAGTSADITDWDFLRIGGHSTTDGERWVGQIPVARVYSRSLTSGQMMDNYKALKNRFNLA